MAQRQTQNRPLFCNSYSGDYGPSWTCLRSQARPLWPGTYAAPPKKNYNNVLGKVRALQARAGSGGAGTGGSSGAGADT